MSDAELRKALEELRERIERLELRLGIAPEREAPPAVKAPPPVTPPITPPTAPPAVPPVAPAPPRMTPPPGVAPPPKARPVVARPPRPAPPREKKSLELMIGRQWLGWVGAIVILFGVGYFVKLAYDQGWIGMVSPLMRCLAAAAFGLLLVGGGELAMRRWGRVAAGGLFSAGLGTLYLTAYGAFHLEVVGEPGGLALLAVTALVGFGLTWRVRMLAIGVLSILGGYATPVLMGDATSFTAATPLYLSMLLFIALALSALSGEPFRKLRYVALAAHALVGLEWIGQTAPSWQVGLVFMTGWWMLVLAESIVAAQREQSANGNAIISFLATAWYVSVGAWVIAGFMPGGAEWLGAFTFACAALAVAVAMTFGPGIEALRGRPRTALEKLAVSLWLQAGVLIGAAIAMQFDGYGRTVAWLLTGLAAVEAGRHIRSKGVSAFGLVLGALALLRIVAFDIDNPVLGSVLLEIGDLSITSWTLLALAGLAVTHVAALRLYDPAHAPDGPVRVVLNVIVALGWLGLCLTVAGAPRIVTAGWTIGGLLMLLLSRAEHNRSGAWLALGMLALVGLWWTGLEAILPRLDDRLATDLFPVLNAPVLLGTAIAVVTGLVLRRLGGRIAGLSQGWQVHWALLAAFAVLVLSHETDRLAMLFEMRNRAAVAWNEFAFRFMWVTVLWAASSVVIGRTARTVQWELVAAVGWMIGIFAAGVWLSTAILPRVGYGPVAVTAIINLQFMTGLAVAALVFAAGRLSFDASHPSALLAAVAGGLIVAGAGLLLGGLEIDRFLDAQPNAKQMWLSVYGALYSVVLVGFGFVRRVPLSRYLGLALFGCVVVKVFAVDMADVETMYRVASAIGVGLLLLGTSIGYAKLAPRLTGGAARDAGDRNAGVRA